MAKGGSSPPPELPGGNMVLSENTLRRVGRLFGAQLILSISNAVVGLALVVLIMIVRRPSAIPTRRLCKK